jgi:hypothetical protein
MVISMDSIRKLEVTQTTKHHRTLGIFIYHTSLRSQTIKSNIITYNMDSTGVVIRIGLNVYSTDEAVLESEAKIIYHLGTSSSSDSRVAASHIC